MRKTCLHDGTLRIEAIGEEGGRPPIMIFFFHPDGDESWYTADAETNPDGSLGPITRRFGGPMFRKPTE